MLGCEKKPLNCKPKSRSCPAAQRMLGSRELPRVRIANQGLFQVLSVTFDEGMRKVYVGLMQCPR